MRDILQDLGVQVRINRLITMKDGAQKTTTFVTYKLGNVVYTWRSDRKHKKVRRITPDGELSGISNN